MEEPALSFGRWRLLPASRQLWAGDMPVPLGSRAFDLLHALVEARGELLTKDELLQRVWPGAVVEENNLQVQVSALRKALGEEARFLIATVPGRGYRFTGAVQARPHAGRIVAAMPDAVPTVSSTRPMLAVLPFANMTDDPEQEYFADGITEDLTTHLSHLRWFSVIARNSAFTYKGRPIDVRQVGRELNVRYVLQGSVRKAGGRVRITAQLCEAETARHIWAEHFDGDLADIFALQDRVTEAVVGAIEPSLRQAEVERARAKPTEKLGAYDLYLRALPLCRFGTRKGSEEALGLLRRALALDAGFIAAKAALAGLVLVRFTQRLSADGEVEEAIRCARDVAEEGGADDPSSLAWAGFALARLARDYEAGLAAADRALLLAPNSALALFYSGWTRIYAGDWQVAVERIEDAMRLSPVDPLMFHFTGALGAAYFVGEQYEKAVEWVRRAIRDRPSYVAGRLGLATSLAWLGRQVEAEEAVRALHAILPGETLATIGARCSLQGPARERYLDGLRRAGVPE